VDDPAAVTALVNEAYIRLDVHRIQWQDCAHFLAMAARLMRRILVDRARARHYLHPVLAPKPLVRRVPERPAVRRVATAPSPARRTLISRSSRGSPYLPARSDEVVDCGFRAAASA
jgi:hypothetical protein